VSSEEKKMNKAQKPMPVSFHFEFNPPRGTALLGR